MDLRGIAEAQRDPHLAGLLLGPYEHTPCSQCREYVVDLLIKRKARAETPASRVPERLQSLHPQAGAGGAEVKSS